MSVTNSLKPWAFKYNMLLITQVFTRTQSAYPMQPEDTSQGNHQHAILGKYCPVTYQEGPLSYVVQAIHQDTMQTLLFSRWTVGPRLYSLPTP